MDDLDAYFRDDALGAWPSFHSPGPSRDATEDFRTQVSATPLSTASDDFRYSQSPHDANRLSFMPLTDWSEDAVDDQSQPVYIKYSIEWKITLNGRVRAREAEQDVVLAPRDYWEACLREKLNVLSARKLPTGRTFYVSDADMIISVSGRGERALPKNFKELEIDWTLVEKQLRSWSHLLQSQKRLRVEFAFNYIESVPDASQLPGGHQATTRGSRSATRSMLQDRALLLDAEEDSTGQPSAWRDVYRLMRCPGPPCHLEPHCWHDRSQNKRFKLKTHHLSRLVKYVQEGNRLESHADMPEEIRQQLYAEKQQLAEQQSRTSANRYPPITITNVLPGTPSPGLASVSTPSDAPFHTSAPPSAAPARRLHIPGARDVAVERYGRWQCSKVTRPNLLREYEKICEITLDEGLDLELVHEQRDYMFYVDKGVKRGVAQRFVRDIEEWVELYHEASDPSVDDADGLN